MAHCCDSLALTGQRKSEVAEARWPEFDLEQKLWAIPPERMKADAAHVVPLTPQVVEILQSLPRFDRGDRLFSTTFGTKPVNGFSKAKEILDRKMAKELGAPVEPFVFHDVRRSVRTGLQPCLFPISCASCHRPHKARIAPGLRPAHIH